MYTPTHTHTHTHTNLCLVHHHVLYVCDDDRWVEMHKTNAVGFAMEARFHHWIKNIYIYIIKSELRDINSKFWLFFFRIVWYKLTIASCKVRIAIYKVRIARYKLTILRKKVRIASLYHAIMRKKVRTVRSRNYLFYFLFSGGNGLP